MEIHGSQKPTRVFERNVIDHYMNKSGTNHQIDRSTLGLYASADNKEYFLGQIEGRGIKTIVELGPLKESNKYKIQEAKARITQYIRATSRKGTVPVPKIKSTQNNVVVEDISPATNVRPNMDVSISKINEIYMRKQKFVKEYEQFRKANVAAAKAAKASAVSAQAMANSALGCANAVKPKTDVQLAAASPQTSVVPSVVVTSEESSEATPQFNTLESVLSEQARTSIKKPVEDPQFVQLRNACLDKTIGIQINEAIKKMEFSRSRHASKFNFYITMSYPSNDKRKGEYAKGNFKTCKVAVKWNRNSGPLEQEPYMVTIESDVSVKELKSVAQANSLKRFTGQKSDKIDIAGEGGVRIRVRAIAPGSAITVNHTKTRKTTGRRLPMMSKKVNSKGFTGKKRITASKMGTSLSDILRYHHLPNIDKANIVKAVFKKLKELHDAGKSHGDVKPDNILVMPDLTVQFIDLPEFPVKPDEQWRCENPWSPAYAIGCCTNDALEYLLNDFDQQEFVWGPTAGEMDQYALLRSIQDSDTNAQVGLVSALRLEELPDVSYTPACNQEQWNKDRAKIQELYKRVCDAPFELEPDNEISTTSSDSYSEADNEYYIHPEPEQSVSCGCFALFTAALNSLAETLSTAASSFCNRVYTAFACCTAASAQPENSNDRRSDLMSNYTAGPNMASTPWRTSLKSEGQFSSSGSERSTGTNHSDTPKPNDGYDTDYYGSGTDASSSVFV